VATSVLFCTAKEYMRANLNIFNAAIHRLPTTPPKPPSSGSSSGSTFQDVLDQQTGASNPTTPPSTPVVTPPAVAQTPTAPAAPAAPAAPSLQSIMSLPNCGLMTNPTGNNCLTGGTIAYNPNYYATLDAANQIAQQVGGSVVDMGGQFSNNQSEYYINLPNGTQINAGNLVAILNNPVYQQNSRVMDGKIAELLNNNAQGSNNVGQGLYTVKNGQVTYDPSYTT
jgi:hypothetical protein